MSVHRIVSIVLSAALAGSAAQAQPDQDPELADERVDDVSEALRRERGTPPPVEPAAPAAAEPVRPHQPGIAAEAGAPGRLVPEGTFLVGQPGMLRRGERGALVFTPAPDPGADPVRAMLVLPSLNTERLHQTIDDAGGAGTGVVLSGRVTLYRGVNYVRVTTIASGSAADEPDEPDAGPPAAPIETPAADEQTLRLIDELESARTGVRGVLAAAAAQGASGGQPAVPEGRTLFRRKGRLVRLDAGEVAVAFDNDASEESVQIDTPLIITPCSWLETIEEIVEKHGDSIAVTVSGQTLAHGNRSYLLPSSVVIERPSELHSRQ